MAKKRTLKTYRDKRDFRKSPEPSGTGVHMRTQKNNPLFVIQQHEARRLHYDLRLEVNGVLKSWAVPKGPSTDPREKRLAVRVEDHPLDYADFEGIIPQGEYGAGTVIVWDAGPYRNQTVDDKGKNLSMDEALDNGEVIVWLEGKKLRGGYALIHGKVRGQKDNWLLIKLKDEGSDARRKPTKTEPESVLTGRTLKQVVAQDATAS
ncbi:MAG: DNA polymerase ligase N-terminal domain-containing protein [Candidatus Binatia bacterium]